MNFNERKRNSREKYPCFENWPFFGSKSLNFYSKGVNFKNIFFFPFNQPIFRNWPFSSKNANFEISQRWYLVKNFHTKSVMQCQSPSFLLNYYKFWLKIRYFWTRNGPLWRFFWMIEIFRSRKTTFDVRIDHFIIELLQFLAHNQVFFTKIFVFWIFLPIIGDFLHDFLSKSINFCSIMLFLWSKREQNFAI